LRPAGRNHPHQLALKTLVPSVSVSVTVPSGEQHVEVPEHL